MGWSGAYATEWKNGQIDRVAEMRKLFKDGAVVKDALVGSTYYAAVKTEDNNVAIFVGLTSVDKFEFWYKSMDASMGPYKYDCPESILKLNTSHNGFTDEWIEKCREKRKNKNLLTKATRVEVTMPYDTNYFSKGDVVKLYKKIARNGSRKSYQWVVDGYSVYFSSRLMSSLRDSNSITVIE